MVDPRLIMAGMQTAGQIARPVPAGPSNAANKSSASADSAQKGVMDGSNWTVNYGAMAQSSPANTLLYAGLAFAAVFVWKKWMK